MTRVLIAEREESIASLLRTLICRLVECDVTVVHDPGTAAATLLEETFDLVLLDIGLHSDGLATLTRITGRNNRCEVIALTTGVIKAPLVRVLAEADVFAVVTKPFDLAQIEEIIRQTLHPPGGGLPRKPLVYRGAGDDPARE